MLTRNLTVNRTVSESPSQPVSALSSQLLSHSTKLNALPCATRAAAFTAPRLPRHLERLTRHPTPEMNLGRPLKQMRLRCAELPGPARLGSH